MNAVIQFSDTDRYERVVAASKAVHWEIDADVIRGRTFDRSKKYLPDGLSLVQEFSTLSRATSEGPSRLSPGTSKLQTVRWHTSTKAGVNRL